MDDSTSGLRASVNVRTLIASIPRMVMSALPGRCSPARLPPPPLVFRLGPVGPTGEVLGDLPGDPEADGIIAQDVVSQAQNQSPHAATLSSQQPAGGWLLNAHRD